MAQMIPQTSSLSDALIDGICRGTPGEARTLSLELSASDRARLAIFCNGKAHLRAHGREVASLCTETSLFQEGGLAGVMLLRQANLEPDSWGGVSREAGRKVSLGGLCTF